MRIAPFLSIPLLLAGCAGPRDRDRAVAPYPLGVAGEGATCRAVAGGRAVAFDDLADVLRAEVPAGRPVLVRTDRETTPYRCIGGAIYLLQRAGVRDFAFDPPWPDLYRPK